MAVFVKICGICSKSDLEQISALGPDALGFVFWKRSTRYVDPLVVGTWETPVGIKRVGVFVNPSQKELQHAVELAKLDVIQVHRVPYGWTVDKAEFAEQEIWQAVNADEWNVLQGAFSADRILMDSYDPVTIGGTGKTCDWNQAREWVEQLDTPILLAGGLTPENVEQAIEQVHPWGVDISSGVEWAPGRKNIEKVSAFITACRL